MKLIAREIGCSPTTVSNEIKRGTIPMYKNRSPHYRAKAGQAVYEANRHNSCRTYDYVLKSKFINYVSDHFFNDAWSLDACCGRAVTEGIHQRRNGLCKNTPTTAKRSSKTVINAFYMHTTLSSVLFAKKASCSAT